jgi:hypothetical protein
VLSELAVKQREGEGNGVPSLDRADKAMGRMMHVGPVCCKRDASGSISCTLLQHGSGMGSTREARRAHAVAGMGDKS